VGEEPGGYEGLRRRKPLSKEAGVSDVSNPTHAVRIVCFFSLVTGVRAPACGSRTHRRSWPEASLVVAWIPGRGLRRGGVGMDALAPASCAPVPGVLLLLVLNKDEQRQENAALFSSTTLSCPCTE
jgi:hypothetical protein